MRCVAIKDKRTGSYYAGCNKPWSRTLLGAQLYRSSKIAQNVIDKSRNFNITIPEIVIVTIEETEVEYGGDKE